MSKRNHKKHQVNNPQRILPTSLTQVDVVIPVYGALEFLKSCMEHLPPAKGNLSYKVYILDNNSPNKEEANKVFVEIGTKYGNIIGRLKRSDVNLGFPKGCNQGAKFGRSPYILFLNTDVNLQPDTVSLMLATMKEDEKIGIVCPKLLFPKDTPSGKEGTIQHAGLDMNIRTDLVHTFIGWSADAPKANVRGEVYACTGACFLIKRDLFQKVGGFFEGYGNGTYEDIELCLQISNMGYKIFYEPKAVGTHHVGASARENKVGFTLNENRALFQLRNGKSFFWSEWLRW